MTSVELVKNICKSRKIPLSRLEKDLGYSNGYIAQLRKGVFPSDRLAEIAEYLGVSIDSLLCAETDEADGVYRVPVLGRVAAGVPLFAAEEIIDWEELPKIWKRKGEYFGLQIKGNSMEPRMIEGDVVIVRQQEKRSFTEEEILMLWEDHDNGHEFTAYALLMIYTGMRPGELMQMKIADVHLDATPPYMVGGIKTEAGKNRMFPIAKVIVPLVERMCERGKKKLLEMNEDNFRKAFNEMTARAGTRPLKPHECRHTFCSELALQGVQPGVIMRIAGHANYQTTAGYTHIQQLEESAKAVDKIG